MNKYVILYLNLRVQMINVAHSVVVLFSAPLSFFICKSTSIIMSILIDIPVCMLYLSNSIQRVVNMINSSTLNVATS